MDNRIELELNKVGQTISDLPQTYSMQQMAAVNRYLADEKKTPAWYILHLADVIDRMETAIVNMEAVPDGKPGMHMKICKQLNDIYTRKNNDYGDSFHQSFLEQGMAMARIRLSDKLNRFKTLTRGAECMVNGESVKDTLLDMANYAIMTVMEIEETENVE